MFECFYSFYGLNEALFLIVNKATNFGIFPRVLQIISWVFSIANFSICYIALCLYHYTQLKQINDLNQRQIKFWYLYNEIVLAGIIYTIFGLIYAILKFSINLPRPFCSLESVNFTTIANIASERCLSSFPSAHTGLAFLVAYLLWKYFNLAQKIIAILIVMLVAISRISLAMHYPSDIIYSLVIVLFIIVAGDKAYMFFRDNIIQKIGTIIYTKITAKEIQFLNEY
jgi:membrane-associated phospholipid phosphatase